MTALNAAVLRVIAESTHPRTCQITTHDKGWDKDWGKKK